MGITTGNIRKNFSFLPAFDRSKYWDKVGTNVAGGAVFCVEDPSDEGNAMAYDVELLSKGILLSSEREFDKVIQSSGDKELLAKFERLRTDRQKIEVWNMKPVEERPADEVVRLESEAEQLEKELIEGSKEYGDFTRSLAIEWKDVRDALRDGDVAIEFAKVAVDTTDNYVALLLRKGWNAPKCVNFGAADEFGPYLSMGANDLYRSQQFSDMVWAGITEVADLQEGDNVYFSPDGIFYHIAIENLPTADGRIMADRFNICRLSSTRELCMTPSAMTQNSAVLYGGLRYDRSQDDAGTSKVAATKGESRDMYIGMLLAERGLSEDDADRGTIQYLPGTRAEADALAKMLSRKRIACNKYTEYDGTEESFKALSGTAPKIIHIATHGFYLSPTEAEELSRRRQRGFLTSGDDSQNSVIDFSMSRSGLLFSGSQPAWFGRPIPEGVDDGILTAKEIAGLDLKGAELAVLSACSTANGEVTGDGVAGLQRGFKKAGVKTLLMTLWPVSDNATQLFMTKFYKGLTSGKTKRQSFYAAVRFLRESDDYSEPQYWAPFILLD